MNPFLNFNGNAEEAFNFYNSIFGGEFGDLQRWKNMPGSERFPADDQNKIMHITLPIGNGNVLIAGDALASRGQTMMVGDNFGISLDIESKEETDRIYNALVKGGTPHAEMPIRDSFWGSYFGMLTDKFGVRWMVNYTYPKK